MHFVVVRPVKEIEALAQRLEEGKDNGTKYPGMSYEEGALAMLEFLEGRIEANELYES